MSMELLVLARESCLLCVLHPDLTMTWKLEYSPSLSKPTMCWQAQALCKMHQELLFLFKRTGGGADAVAFFFFLLNNSWETKQFLWVNFPALTKRVKCKYLLPEHVLLPCYGLRQEGLSYSHPSMFYCLENNSKSIIAKKGRACGKEHVLQD